MAQFNYPGSWDRRSRSFNYLNYICKYSLSIANTKYPLPQYEYLTLKP